MSAATNTGIVPGSSPRFSADLAATLLHRVMRLLRLRDGGSRWLRYDAVGLVLLLVIWAPALSYLVFGPARYVSKWSLVLPGAGSGAQVNLETVGQASTLSSSPYGNHAVDPKANYRAIATSGPVIAEAAKRIDINRHEFANPRVKLIDQTAVMEFTVIGPTGEEAQRRSYALFTAFIERLEQLRLDEMTRREEGTRRALALFEEKLRSVEEELLDFQSEAGIVSIDQFRDLARNAEELRKQRAEVLAEQRRAEGEATHLTELLNMPAETAADSFLLLADELFQSHLQALGEADSNLTTFRSKWGKAHPRVIKEQSRRRDAESALLARAETLLGSAHPATMTVASALAESGHGALLRTLVEVQAHSEGLTEKVEALELSLAEFEKRLRALTEKTAALESLERRHQVATAVFTSALARMELGRSDIYVSYPLVQMLSEPTLPQNGLPPNKLYALLGATAGSLFFISGLVLLWLRRPFIRKTQKSV